MLIRWLCKTLVYMSLYCALPQFTFGMPRDGCVITELYRDPPGTEGTAGGGSTHEFIEIVNIGRDPVTLDSLFVTNGIESDSIVSVRKPIRGHEQCRYGVTAILPGMIAVILDPDYRGWCEQHDNNRFMLPDSTVLLECGDPEFGMNGFAADHGACIYRGTKNRIDTIICSAADPLTELQTPAAEIIRLTDPVNIEGISLGAVDILTETPYFDYSADSLDPGTFAPLHDGWLLEYRFVHHDEAAVSVTCSLFVQCLAASCSSGVVWSLERDSRDHVADVVTGTIRLYRGYGCAAVVVPIDSVQLRWRLRPPSAAPADDAPAWNIDGASFLLPRGALCVTELFPRATASEPEWLELCNNAAVPVNLRNWRMSVGPDTMTLSLTEKIIPPGSFAVITRNGTALAAKYRYPITVCEPDRWISLDNTSDTVTFFDRNGYIHETVCYDGRHLASWPSVSLVHNGGGGCSDGWEVADRSTPGLPARRRGAETTAAPGLDIGPLPFTPDNDGRDDRLAIRLSGAAPGTAGIFIYGLDGRLVRTFPDVRPDIIYWDGRGDNGPVPPGPFFVVAEFTTGKKVTRFRKKGILWRK